MVDGRTECRECQGLGRAAIVRQGAELGIGRADDGAKKAALAADEIAAAGGVIGSGTVGLAGEVLYRSVSLAEDATLKMVGCSSRLETVVLPTESPRLKMSLLLSAAVLLEKVLLVTVMAPLWLNSPPPNPLPAVPSSPARLLLPPTAAIGRVAVEGAVGIGRRCLLR